MSQSETLSEAAGSGDRRRALEALRTVLVTTIQQAETREVAALARQLALVLKELDELPAARGRSTFDDLAARRRNRGSTAAG